MARPVRADAFAKKQKKDSSAMYPDWLKCLPQDGFTYKEYLAWDDGIRVELLDGLVYMMAGASAQHQERVLDFGSQLKNFWLFRHYSDKSFLNFSQRHRGTDVFAA